MYVILRAIICNNTYGTHTPAVGSFPSGFCVCLPPGSWKNTEENYVVAELKLEETICKIGFPENEASMVRRWLHDL